MRLKTKNSVTGKRNRITLKGIVEYGDRCLAELPAFIEMWGFVKKLPMASTPEKQILRYQAKLKMSKAPTLSRACPAGGMSSSVIFA